jgi:hypothetical protein
MSARSKVFIKMLLEELFTKGEHTNNKLYKFLNVDAIINYECENDKSLGSNIDDMLNSFVKHKRSKKKILKRYTNFDDEVNSTGYLFVQDCGFSYTKDIFKDILIAYDYFHDSLGNRDYEFMNIKLNMSIISTILAILGLDDDDEKENRLNDAMEKLNDY